MTKTNAAKTKPAKVGAAATKPARKTKKSQLLALLEASKGRSVAELSEALGWQRHTTHAALTGLRLSGNTIEKLDVEGERAARYRLTGAD
ncbi:DUF3489 domain-containing protein [Euryhalocaulis caribicus]|uniref:DUF3489 domain-containing protein n=1 Tax=Euryhalocaulis caribicus TaxID=1161401 RepID=UPI0003A50DF5|nr:DUF3489 domain-containing protein [Euryhalocaulis caribicus]